MTLAPSLLPPAPPLATAEPGGASGSWWGRGIRRAGREAQLGPRRPARRRRRPRLRRRRGRGPGPPGHLRPVPHVDGRCLVGADDLRGRRRRRRARGGARGPPCAARRADRRRARPVRAAPRWPPAWPGSYAMLLGARCVQGVGAALLLGGSIAVLGALRGADARGRAWWAWAATIGTALGPALGGVLTELLDWRAIFLVQAPLAAVALWPCSRRKLGGSRPRRCAGRDRGATGAAPRGEPARSPTSASSSCSPRSSARCSCPCS